jgi:hypothetical protein
VLLIGVGKTPFMAESSDHQIFREGGAVRGDERQFVYCCQMLLAITLAVPLSPCIKLLSQLGDLPDQGYAPNWGTAMISEDVLLSSSC